MNKLTNIFLAGITVIGMNGCLEDDSPSGIQSVNINDLVLGYKVSGTGEIANSAIDSITFCPVYTFNERVGTYPYDDRRSLYDGDTDTRYTGDPDYLSTGFFEVVNDYHLYVDDASGDIFTDTGTLDVGTDYDGWTVTSIEEDPCTPIIDPR